MAEATNVQMQAYCDQRLRVRAEQFRALLISFRDDKAAIDDVYERAAGANPWNDARTDGPPSLLASSDVLAFNSFATLFIKCFDGVATAQDVADMKANLAVFQSACVRPVGS